MPTDGAPPSADGPKDPELKQLLAEIAFEDALAKLAAGADSAQSNLKRLEDPGLGPSRAVDIHKSYYQRECDKAQLQIEIFKLRRNIEQLRSEHERACSPGMRRRYEQRCRKIQAGRLLGRRQETTLPESPELQAKRKLDDATASLKSKEERLQVMSNHDADWKTLIDATPVPRRVVTQAPRPPRILSGTGWVPPKPRPAEVPTSFPPDFPTSLRLKTSVILGEIVKEFPDRSKLVQLCTEIVLRLTDLMCIAVREGTVEAHVAPDRLNELLHYVRVGNCSDSNVRFQVEKAVMNSDPWHTMLRQLAECEDLKRKAGRPVRAMNANPTQERIEAFRQKLTDVGYTITKKDIWQVAGYTDRTEFERFQRQDPRTTPGSAANFNRVLNLTPEAFMQKRANLRSK